MEHFLYADDKEVEDMLCYRDYIIITEVHGSDAFSDNYIRNKEDSVIGMIGIFKSNNFGMYEGWESGDFIHDKDIKEMESLNENWNYDYLGDYYFNGIKFKYIYR